VTELQRQFRSFFDQVVHTRAPLFITRARRPEAVLIVYEDYIRFREMQESKALARFDRARQRLDALNVAYTDDEIAADIQAARGK
jgi:prevent-host-death family protein